ncbi:MAG TPA: TlpA disulfide reductase family protein [Polyangia bacterium]|nr:TlpA disulfide reductase family protein [Polyangia bacterium]
MFLSITAAGCAARTESLGSRSMADRPQPAGGFRDVMLTDLDGRPTRLVDALGRRPALVSFWAPWCEPCVREQPALQRLSQQAHHCGATVLGVAVGENREAIADFTRARQLSFPQLTDQEFRLADALGQRRIPATLVLNADQGIVFSGDGLDGRAVAALKNALQGDPAAGSCSLQ